MKLVPLALAIAAAFAACPAAAGVYWRGDATAEMVVLIDFSTLETQPNGDRSFILRRLSPRGTKVAGRSVAVTSVHSAVNCDAGTVRILGGAVFDDDAQLVSRLPPDPGLKTPPPGSPGWRHLRLVCAGSDAERTRFGTFIGEATLGDVVERLRPAARQAN